MQKQLHVRCAQWKECLFAHPTSSWLWLVVRLYLAFIWLMAGYEKLNNPAWVGPEAGGAISGFVAGALAKAAGTHPDVTSWYARFLQNCVATIPAFWAHLISFSEVAVGLGLFLGVLTTWAAIGGALMNYNFLLAGSVSVNPLMLPLELGLILAWRVSSKIGLCPIIRKLFFQRIEKAQGGQ